MLDSTLQSQLIDIVGENNLLIDDESKNNYGSDLTQHYKPNPLAIVFPETEEQVVEIVKFANSALISLVPSGGRTGYSAGAVAKDHELVVSFDKMNRILDFNTNDWSITCQPGVTTQAIQDFALQHDLFYPVDFASSGTSQIGGNIATNAGGIKVIRYGMTRDWVSGLNVVTGNGDLLKLNHGLIKNASGYDFRHLFIGSEGTLGIITEAVLNLTTPPNDTKVILFSVLDNTHFGDILDDLSKTVDVVAFEFFSDQALQHVLAETNKRHPFSKTTPFYVLLEYESSKESDELVADVVEKFIHREIISDALQSQDIKQAKEFWRFREAISMSILKYSPYKYDISVLPSKIPVFIKEVDALFKKLCPSFEVIWFGHIGDGNLHLNILNPSNLTKDEFFTYCTEMSEKIYALIQKHKGSISAEHGVGLLKKDFLHYARDEKEIAYMRDIKNLFDKNNIMNPGKMI